MVFLFYYNKLETKSIQKYFSLGSLSVKIAPYGWAWLVCGRRLFVWKYKQSDTKRSCSCYELQLPPSDLSHKADLVCVLDNSKGSQSVPSTIAVTPEGNIRYWPNIAYDGHSIEANASDIQGQECTSLTDIEPLGCILGTTTSSLVHIAINKVEGLNSIMCRTLKVPQGMLAGIGRKVTSLLFGSMPATHSTEVKQLFKVVRTQSSDSIDSDDVFIWVLSNVSAQKWRIIDEQTDRLIGEIDLERAVKEAFLDEVWNRETTHPNQLKIWLLDIGIRRSNEMVLLVAGLNADVSNQLYYAIVTFSDTNQISDTNISLNSFTVLRNHTVCYTEDDEEQLLNLHLLSGPINSSMVYIYNSAQVLSLRIGTDEIDLIDFETRDDRILGAGVCDGFPLLFTHKDGLLSVIPHKQDISEVMDVRSLDEDILQTDDKVMALKKAFVLYTKGDTARSQYFVNQLFPLMDSTISQTDSLDDCVLAISDQICDEIPHSDPRWAESGPLNQYPNETLTASLIITNQIEEKIRSHRLLVEFLKSSNLWERLTTTSSKSSTSVLTKQILCQHMEKMVASLAFKKLHNEYNNILEDAIKIVLNRRNDSLQPRLTPQDIFYRQTSRVEEIITALIECQSQQIDVSSNTSRDLLNCLLSTTHILITVFQEICHFRQTQGSLYESSHSKSEYIPWTSSGGPDGIRTALLKQLDFLVTFGIESTKTTAIEEDIQLKGAVCQKIVELSDVILDGFVCQLRSIDSTHRHQTVEQTFQSIRSKCIEPLIKVRQYDRAIALAEKYHDFDVLIQICERLNDTERLRRYLIEYGSQGFAEHLSKWYLKEGKQGKLIAITANIHGLSTYLEPHKQLVWLHQIHLDQYSEASLTLKKLAEEEKNFAERKRTLLSLSKLSLIAAGLPVPEEIDDELEQIEESLCRESLDAKGLTQLE